MEDRDEPSTRSSILDPPSSISPRSVWPAYACESCSSVGTVLLQVAIFFYTTRYFGWGAKQNLLLAASQGIVYIIGSLSSAPIVARLGRRLGDGHGPLGTCRGEPSRPCEELCSNCVH